MTKTLRKDSLIKSLGTAQYTDDIDIGEFLYGQIVGVPVSKGRLTKIIFDPEYDWNKFVICTASDLEKENLLPPKESDEPILVEDEVNYYGQPAVLLANSDKDILKEATTHISFEFESETATIGINIDHPVNQVFSSKTLSVGDSQKGMAESEYILEGTYSTAAQEHLYLETQIIVAHFDEETQALFIEGSMQAPFNVRDALLRSFKNRVKEIVVAPHLSGGAFGGREDFTTQIALQASLLAIKSGKKIKLKLDRSYDLPHSTKRHPSITKVKTGIKNNKINSLEVDFLLDGGAYETISSIVLSRAMLHPGSFTSPNILVTGKAVQTNTPPNGAFRGFGAPQIFFAVESHLDHCIRQLVLNEIDFRKNNLLTSESASLSSQKMGGYGVNLVFEEAIDFCSYENLKLKVKEFNESNRKKKMGLGIASVFHGTGYTGFQDIDTPISVVLRKSVDGGVTIESSVVDFGQGSHTVLSQIVATTLNIPLDRVSVKNINTQITPSSGATVASRTTTVLGTLVEKAASKLLASMGSKEESSVVESYHREEPFDYETMQGHAYENYASATTVSLLEVDLVTYSVKVLDVYMALDVGRIVNRSSAEGQVQGGVLQGIGFALCEEMKISDTGYLNESLSQYAFPSSQETPNIHIKFIEDDTAKPKGLGEIPICGMAPSIANALEDALGVRYCSLPITPEKIEQALR
ncbi:TPA: hypothetical protein DIU27_03440 [Candidatus Collierbacteria bacterium]|uniref:Aerobic-type carbon monoxide dehydrogenase, large subunit CoxL/CutL-like protein n=1 Tax=Candidatus Collierbacteria bacterium GW2011_GWB2_44_22 TaxID=1618387 RepID=A0A0G1K7F1_9BACT|nr:MAG: Aerobic-type carbon monoxide dehydrogenase, large subunit CoxL/CutL-like protein [Candidatus Collierbacteria bacterium GW2011_GWB2_44_22]KKT62394.1 MAG: Aerobic-type carbon monoxide dehydrogenase, large subunit CoxL/CutL-like protein [Candidatus Collierbacteria bacterium GW2011_GWD1_44_27]KKT89251.1 MAG: Aerobic-type carbon monoxide dehydrogenase, large subunit CoxL/CutL-like protein [Candidatus Collierbacteria bacterium GW2011_GWD2_45_10]HCQ31406.1 hypothetical protein [Candidatus Colli